MTAESLKPFLNTPLGALSRECDEKKSTKCFLIASGAVIVLALVSAIVGLETWNLNRINDLQREVDNLKMQVHEIRQLGAIGSMEDFSDFEQAYNNNENQPSSDEYDDDVDANNDDDEGESDDIEEGSTSVFGIPDYRVDDIETEITVAEAAAPATSATSKSDGGKRRARSISGMTYQGVPIMEESYLNHRQHHNRSHQHQRMLRREESLHYQQMRQRSEETVTPPPRLKLKWNDDNREIPSNHHQQPSTPSVFTTDSVPISRHTTTRKHHSIVHHRPISSTSSSVPSPQPAIAYVRRNEQKFSSSYSQSNLLGPDYTTKSPEPAHNRRSRVMMTTGGDNKFQKVIKNPGTLMESRQPPVQKVGRLMRKSSAAPRVTALHLAKYHHHYSGNLRATNHVNWHWYPVDAINQEALNSNVFKLSHDGVLTVNDTGLYFVYAQITYADQHPVSGFNILVNNRKHASCSVHGQHGKKTNTCYTAALVDLDYGAQIEIKDMDEDRVHLPFQEKTFFGLYKVGRRPVVT